MKALNFFLIFFLIIIFCSCGKAIIEDADAELATSPKASEFKLADAPTLQNGTSDIEKPQNEEQLSDLSDKEKMITGILETLTLDEKIGQMFICSFETNESGGALTEIDERTSAAIEKNKIGGIIYFVANIDTASQTAKLSEDLQAVCKIPLFIATDEEGGRVSRITRSGKIDAAKLPPAKQIGGTGEPKKANEAAITISDELKQLGINLNFAPCADLSTDNSGVIGDRAFSGDPVTAAEFVLASLEGYEAGGIISCIKHFPGHGVAPGDTHNEKIVSVKSLTEILEADMLPFVAAAKSGAPMIMASHITVSEWGKPSSMSSEAISLIRDGLGYKGVIITDSFCMGAITNYYKPDEAAVNAIKAGVDIVLMPEDLDMAVHGVKTAVLNGEIKIEAIEDSVYRILELKYDYGILSVINDMNEKS